MATNKHEKVVVGTLPKCDFCAEKAQYDGKTNLGPWGYMCQAHFKQFGVGLGLGKGQKLVLQSEKEEANA